MFSVLVPYRLIMMSLKKMKVDKYQVDDRFKTIFNPPFGVFFLLPSEHDLSYSCPTKASQR